jgi:hypothetical protein
VKKTQTALAAFVLLVACCVSATVASADGITVAGTITQSTPDGTGPAVNNPSLNNIADGDSYILSLNFTGAITGSGTYDLTGGTLVFSDLSASSSESSFTSISLTVTPDGASDDLSLFACLSTGSACLFGDSLSLNFAVSAADLNSPSALAAAIFGLSPPLDLLEDDGTTDIQAGVASYSYASASSNVPEPESLTLVGGGLFAVALVRRKRQSESVSL